LELKANTDVPTHYIMGSTEEGRVASHCTKGKNRCCLYDFNCFILNQRGEVWTHKTS